jgi:acetylornithine/N-succinyldiaminopimelate aminotransferase
VTVGAFIQQKLQAWQQQYPNLIADVRGRGLLLALELKDKAVAARIYAEAMARGVLLNLKHGTILRFFPALTITATEAQAGLAVVKQLLDLQ